MEGLLILIGIWVLDVVIKKVAANRKKQQQQPPLYQPDDEDAGDGYEPQDETQEQHPPRSLQDLIRQFEEAQQQASQGNIEPPTPPVEKRRAPNKPLTLRDIAEVVIGVDFVNLEFLMEEFEVDENTAAEMLMALQAHHIVGHDMGEGNCDVLVHDLEELDNLFSREKRAAQEKAQRQEQEQQRLVERQRELNELEERAKAARESAAAIANANAGNDGSEEATPRRAPLVSTRSIADVRKGFIWAKVLDEPRFKRRWCARTR
ncbi:MAG: hypothetical protein IJ909_02305 [Fibrobacter sp.]|nr:hypothetical protein [Fibrobacter sp.]